MLENKMLIDSYWMNLWNYSNEAELVEDLLDVDDDERDELEAEFGSMDNVDIDVLAEIVESHTGISPIGVEWDDQFDTIVYKFYEEVA